MTEQDKAEALVDFNKNTFAKYTCPEYGFTELDSGFDISDKTIATIRQALQPVAGTICRTCEKDEGIYEAKCAELIRENHELGSQLDMVSNDFLLYKQGKTRLSEPSETPDAEWVK